MKKLIALLSVCFVSSYLFGQTTMATVKPGSHVMKDDEITIQKGGNENELADCSIEEAKKITLDNQAISLSKVFLKAKQIILTSNVTKLIIHGEVILECDDLDIAAASGLTIDESSRGILTINYRSSIKGGIKTSTSPLQKWSNVTIRFEKIN